MKIAIHDRPNSFSDRWIAYCKRKNIPHKIVNGYDSNIINQLEDCDVFLWHHHHTNFKDVLIARSILFALQHSGKKVFPDWNTNWHFDDKVAQKYLLEAINAPLVPSYVFYEKRAALEWIESTDFPKVFKLRGGAGAANVSLVKTKKDALSKIQKAFKKGFPQFNRWRNLKERIRRFKNGDDNAFGIIKGVGRLFITHDFSKKQGKERGYIYFQDFIPANDSDIRVIVIKNRAFAIKRMVRKNDFRASGSGTIIYDREAIDVNCVRTAFIVQRQIKTQSVAFDFVLDENKNPLIVEISYGFAMLPYDNCPGYWDEDLKWYEGDFNPQEWMLENLLNIN